MNATEKFLSSSKEVILNWVKNNHELKLKNGFDVTTSKKMIEQEVLFWITKNEYSDEVKNEILNYLESL